MSNKNDNVNKNLRRIKGVGGKILRIGKRKRMNRKVERHARPASPIRQRLLELPSDTTRLHLCLVSKQRES
jgi:hypothetical protein